MPSIWCIVGPRFKIVKSGEHFESLWTAEGRREPIYIEIGGPLKTTNCDKESKCGRQGVIILLQPRFDCRVHEEVSSCSTHKVKIHEENQGRWDTYVKVQNQKIKEIQEDMELNKGPRSARSCSWTWATWAPIKRLTLPRKESASWRGEKQVSSWPKNDFYAFSMMCCDVGGISMTGLVLAEILYLVPTVG